MSENRFLQAIAHLLPPGFAFPRALSSTLMRTMSAWAQQLLDRHEWVQRMIQQWMPHRTCTRLEEWEEALGLPDACFGDDQDEEQRRESMLGRLRGDIALPYDDSSADSPGAIEAYLANYGFVTEVWYNTPFRVGRNRCGDRLGVLNGILRVRVKQISEPFRVGRNRVGQRLRIDSRDGLEVLCLLRRVVPARFEIDVQFA